MGYQFCGGVVISLFYIIRLFVFPCILCSLENEKREQNRECVIKVRIGLALQSGFVSFFIFPSRSSCSSF